MKYLGKNFIKIIFLLNIFVFFSAQAFMQISEISPLSLSNESEWVEIEIFPSDRIHDITHALIGSSFSHAKKFTDFFDNIFMGDNLENLSGISIDTRLVSGSGATFTGSGYLQTSNINDVLVSNINDKNSGYFYLNPSPVSLKDSGNTIYIFDNLGQKMDKFTYPNTKYKTKSGKKYKIEIWNRLSNHQVYPLWYVQNSSYHQNSLGKKNLPTPSLPNDVEIVINEISPKNIKEKRDFIELFIKSGKNPINLKYAKLKHNGKTVWENHTDFIVKSGDYLLIYPEKGISSGSGTVELWLWSDMSYKSLEDFVCYKNKKLSKTESTRVKKFKKYWSGDCIEISGIITQESIARNKQSDDTDGATDFFRHYLGSPKKINTSTSKTPIAKIKVQGSGRLLGAAPFSINLTGEYSSDPDGSFDIKKFIWKKNDIIFSEKINPASFKIHEIGDHKISLTISDYAGNTDLNEIIVTVLSEGGSVPSAQYKKYLEQNWKKNKKAFNAQYKYITKGLSRREKKEFFTEEYNEFFDDFIKNMPDNFHSPPAKQRSSFDTNLIISSNELFAIDINSGEKIQKIYKRDKMTISKKRLRKNIGLIFLNNEN